ncbi:hypothetical protein GCM10009760_19660 [Kitasatospora kazusensis]|uniref:Permuted papain-like amidase YaeF/Yiix C92 family enzyme n=1 Tax=Kitasatospora kazusensis TaxID=407974 RepID=A0ABP5KWD9_9ACTN
MPGTPATPAASSPSTTPLPPPQPGDFAVVRMGGSVGRLIRIGQWLNGDGFADYEHAFVYVGDGELVEAQPGGAVLTPLADYEGRPILWSTGHIVLDDEQRRAVVAAARGYLGVPYSAADYLALATHRFHLPVSPLLKGFVADTRHMICSQLVDQCYRDAGVRLFADGRWPGYVTPADLARLLRS